MDRPEKKISIARKAAFGVAALIVIVAVIAVFRAPDRYAVQGVVRGIDLEQQQVVVDHEAIPGYMAAMTMPFNVRNPEILEGLQPGDVVEFDLIVRGESSYSRNFTVTGHEEAVESEAESAQRPSRRYEAGDAVAQVSMTGEDGDSIDLVSTNRYTIGTFIFTRCPLPEFCPLLSTKFSRLQETIRQKEPLTDQVRLLSITLDPEYDRPEVLADYAKRQNADPEIWRFATASLETIENLAWDFRVFREMNGAMVDHALCTFVLSPQGRVVDIWRGNRWEPADVLEALGEAMPGEPQLVGRTEQSTTQTDTDL